MADNYKRSVTCKEIHEQITAYVDNRVDEQEYRTKVQQHIKYCPDCRAAYELELMTKMVVRDHSQRSPAPDSLRRTIADQVGSISDDRKERIARGTVHGAGGGGWLDRFAHYFTSPVGVGVAFVLIVVGVYALYDMSGVGETIVREVPASPAPRGGTPVAEGPENFFNKAAKNFEAIQAGDLTVQHETDDRSDLMEYFKKNGVAYDVAFMPVRAPLAGGVISEHKGATRLAHIVYVAGDTIIYLFEVPASTLKRGDIVYLTEDVLKQLDEGKTFWEEPGVNARLAMFKKESLVVAAVSNAPRPALERILAMN